MKKHLKKIIELDKEFKSLGEPCWNEDNFMIYIKGKWTLSVALFKDNLEGYLIVSNKKGKAHIHRFLVSKENRGFDFGFWMFQQLKKNCIKLDINVISLNVNKSNKIAIKFYKNLGFKVMDKKDRFYYMERNIGDEK